MMDLENHITSQDEVDPRKSNDDSVLRDETTPTTTINPQSDDFQMERRPSDEREVAQLLKLRAKSSSNKKSFLNPKLGDIAADFTLLDQNRQESNLATILTANSATKPTYIVLFFFPQAFSPGNSNLILDTLW